jgi:hypothetical protein
VLSLSTHIQLLLRSTTQSRQLFVVGPLEGSVFVTPLHPYATFTEAVVSPALGGVSLAITEGQKASRPIPA